LGWGTRIILISVSTSAFPSTGDFGDFTGRFIKLQMPSWTPEEIRQIATHGFPLLGIDISSATVDLLGRVDGFDQDKAESKRDE